jgi:hypothetical protein
VNLIDEITALKRKPIANFSRIFVSKRDIFAKWVVASKRIIVNSFSGLGAKT